MGAQILCRARKGKAAIWRCIQEDENGRVGRIRGADDGVYCDFVW